MGLYEMLKRLLPLLVVGTVLALLLFFDLDDYFSLEAVRLHQEALLAWASGNELAAPIIYIFGYAAIVTLSLPVAALMTVAGGLLFGTVLGALYAVIGATVGATTLFLIAKTSVGDYLVAGASGTIKKMQKGFAENALNYMFVLRLVPLFPFFLVNLAPAFLGVSLRVYVTATFFGMVPAAYVYALAGSGLGGVLAQEERVTLESAMTTEVMVAFSGLALLSLIPVLYKRGQKVSGESAE